MTSSPPALRLVRPAFADVPSRGPGAPVTLDRDQAAAVASTDRALLVLGAPGTGKTTVALEAVVAAVEGGLSPEDVLVLASGRRAAADLRDRLSARLRRTSGRPLVQTAAAAAFSVLRARSALLGEPVPTLVSGAEQDLLLGDLLAGHAAGEGVPLAWPAEVRPDVLALRPFRDELRDLLMRAAERGLTPVDLAALADAHRRPAWASAARLYEEYLDVVQLRTGTPDLGARLDPAVVVDEAAQALLTWEDDVPGAVRPRWRLVVVDDHQESTSATARLLRVLADDGARVLLLADPDAAVQTFRGATPSLVGRAGVDGTGPGELGARTVVLRTVWRHDAQLRGVVGRITERVGAVGAVQHRRAVAVPTDEAADESGEVRVAILPSTAQEAAFVAHTLRSAHVERGVAWAEMAVVARSGAQVTALRRALAGASVPVSVLGSDVPLREEPAVRPLLDAMRVCVGAAALDAATGARLACSPLGGLDTVGLRRVRRALRTQELAQGGGRTSDALLVEALGADEPGLPLPAAARPVARLARVLAEGRAAAAQVSADAQTVLWALWRAAEQAEPWRRSALAGGAAGERADRDLDAVLALFRAAETFVDRMPRSAPGAFVDWLQAQDLPSDSLAARARRASVQVLTPAGAAGREWDVVVVSGVQEGSWPDLRLRDSLLGAQALVDVVAGRAVPGASDAAESAAAARDAVLADELRSFVVACSRARRSLLVTAVDDADHQPSPFVELVEPSDDDADTRRTSVPSPLDLRGLVAQLRAHLEQALVDGVDPDPAAARTLARLAAADVPGADPTQWHGLAEPSSDEPLWDTDTRVPVSPSKVETAQRCALRWALEAAGGTSSASGGQSLGTLLHAIAQEHPQGTEAELSAALDRRWGELGLGAGWPALATRRKADAMVHRLAVYLRTAGEPLLVEGAFAVETDRASLRGSVDRIELVDDEGSGPVVRVVDLKTGASPPSVTKAAENPQLGAYQLAVDAGAFEGLPAGVTSGGAQLVFLGTGVTAVTRTQEPLGPETDGPSWARTMVDQVADKMAASSFEATVNDLCDRCPVRRSCPVRGEGGQVVA